MTGAGSALVLVVDDNPQNRALAQATLEDEGFVVELAISGEDGIAAFTRARPDCVLLDIRMPGIGGIAACAEIRALPGGAEVPIVFVTAQRDVDTFDRAREAGGDDFVIKPYRPSELVARVTAATKLRRMAAERSELYDLIRQQRDDMMRLQLHKDQLIEFLVHDFKNPVHAIDLLGERISRDPAASERGKEAAAKIRMESRTLMRMITNLLDLGKSDESRLHPQRERLELGPLFEEVAAEMRPRAQASEVMLTAAADGLAACGDHDLVRRILENLVDNAIRHAPEGTTVAISARRADGGIELSVADAGTGIAPGMREQVFDRFVQASGTARTGRGLGLAFCKVAVEAHGGRIWIEDGAPGARFCMRFPDA